MSNKAEGVNKSLKEKKIQPEIESIQLFLFPEKDKEAEKIIYDHIYSIVVNLTNVQDFKLYSIVIYAENENWEGIREAIKINTFNNKDLEATFKPETQFVKEDGKYNGKIKLTAFLFRGGGLPYKQINEISFIL